MAKKQTTPDTLNPENLQTKIVEAEHWVERNPRIVIYIATGLLVVLAGFFGFRFFKDNRNKAGQEALVQAVLYFENDSLELALNGDGNSEGLLTIIDDYSYTAASNLASYYAGMTYLKQGKFELARLYLEDFSSSDILVQARAYAGVGDAYMEEQNFEDAVRFYSKASEHKPNKYFTPGYLLKKALAQEKAGDIDGAIKTYDVLITQYWDAAEVLSAKKLKARIEKNS